VPRFIWPDKPIFSNGNKMGKRYGLIAQMNDHTSIGISKIGDFFRYGGILFVIVGMSIIGLIYALLDTSFNKGHGFGRAFYMIIFVDKLIWVERGLESIYGIFILMVTLIIFLAILNYFKIINEREY